MAMLTGKDGTPPERATARPLDTFEKMEYKPPVLAAFFNLMALLSLAGAIYAGMQTEYALLFSGIAAGIFFVGLSQVISYLALMAHNSAEQVELLKEIARR